jgi:hypothetical protein
MFRGSLSPGPTPFASSGPSHKPVTTVLWFFGKGFFILTSKCKYVLSTSPLSFRLCFLHKWKHIEHSCYLVVFTLRESKLTNSLLMDKTVFSFFFFYCGTGVWTQGPMLAQPFLLWVWGLFQSRPGPQSSYLRYFGSWDSRHTPSHPDFYWLRWGLANNFLPRLAYQVANITGMSHCT